MEVDYSATVEVAIPQAKEIAKSVRQFPLLLCSTQLFQSG
jgi:hypothetical protein